MAIYHTSGGDWGNVLTSSGLRDICLAENMFLVSQNCLGVEVSSILSEIFNENCEYLTSFEESLALLGLSKNSMHVEDNVTPENIKSAVLLSFYSTSCKLQLNSVDKSVTAVETLVNSIGLSYVQNKLIVDAFVQSGVHDVKLSLLAMLVCVLVLSILLGLRVLLPFLFMLCILCSLVISADILPLFGFSSFSVFNVLAVFVITGETLNEEIS